MDISPQDTTTTQPTTDDQELAKALADVLPGATAPTNTDTSASTTSTDVPTPAPSPAPEPAVTPSAPASTDLDGIKKDALNELRPLVDKVELPAEEKFDTYLMLIRSTDDSSLIAPAHAAAQGIADEKRRAEALLDVIKEIDYLSHKQS